MQERREFSRVEDDAIRFRWPGSRRDEPVANLSRSGAKLFTTRSAPVGSLVELELLREGADPLSLLATVRRVERPTRSDREASLGMSVEFRDLDRETDTVLVRWTGDDSEPASGDHDAPLETQQVAALSADYRGKLWEDEPSSPSESEQSSAPAESASGQAASGAEDAPESGGAPESEGALPVGESSEDQPIPVSLHEPAKSEVADQEADEIENARIRELEARLTRAESLAAEALVQLARAERRVEQLEAQDESSPMPAADSARPYAGGEDGTSVLEDPLVAELFSRPVEESAPVSLAPDSSEPSSETPEQTVEPDEPSDKSPAIEMIERVGSGDRRPSRGPEPEVAEAAPSDETEADDAGSNEVVEDPAAPSPIEAEAAPSPEPDAPGHEADEATPAESATEMGGEVKSSGGPISGAVAAFHRLAEDPLETVGFSRSELLGDLAEARPSAADPVDEGAVSDSPETGVEPSAADGPAEGTIPDGEWAAGDSMGLRVSDEDVFVEVVELDEEDRVSDTESESDVALEPSAADVVDPERTSVSGGGAWPDLELEDPIEDEAMPETAQSDEEYDRSEQPEQPETFQSPSSDTEAEEQSDAEEDSEEEVPDVADVADVPEAPSDQGAVSDASAFEDAEGTVDVTAAFDAPSPPRDDVEQKNSLAAQGAVEGSSDDQVSPDDASQVEEFEERAGEEVETVISSAMVEEIPAGGVEPASPDSASAPSAAFDQANVESKNSAEGPAENPEEAEGSLHLTLADLPTSSEMVAALGTGRIVRTPRFNRLEPVSRLDIEISDLLRKIERLDELEAKTRGRISPTALHRVLFVFFERGLIAVAPEG